MRTVHGSPYTFSVKPKWRMVVFWFFATRSSAVAYLRTSPPRGHSTVGVPKRCEGFVAIWLRAREDIAHNRFQLLFIYTSRKARLRRSSLLWRAGEGCPATACRRQHIDDGCLGARTLTTAVWVPVCGLSDVSRSKASFCVSCRLTRSELFKQGK